MTRSTPSSRLAVSLVVGLFLLPIPSAGDRAERPLGPFLRRARSVEILKLVEATGRQIVGTVVVGLRGRQLGAAVRYPRPLQADLPRAGGELLLACGEGLCVWGLPSTDGSFFELVSPWQTVFPPGLVERQALAPLAAGRPAPELCLRARLRYTDESRRSELLRARVDAASGRGRVSGGLFPLGEPQAQVLVDRGRVTITIAPDSATSVVFSGAAPRRAAEGCLDATVSPDQPLARSRRALLRALRGQFGQVTLARGHLDVRGGDGVGPGTYPLRVTVSREGGLAFRAEPLRETRPGQTYSRLSGELLSFAASRRGRYLSLGCGLARGPELPRLLAEKLFAAGPMGIRCTLRSHGINDEGAVVGAARLVHVPDE